MTLVDRLKDVAKYELGTREYQSFRRIVNYITHRPQPGFQDQMQFDDGEQAANFLSRHFVNLIEIAAVLSAYHDGSGAEAFKVSASAVAFFEAAKYAINYGLRNSIKEKIEKGIRLGELERIFFPVPNRTQGVEK